MLDCFRHPPQLLHFAGGTRASSGNIIKPSIHLLVRFVLKAGIRIFRIRGLEVKDVELMTSQVLKGVLQDLLAHLGGSHTPSVDMSLPVHGGHEEAGIALVTEDEMFDDVVSLVCDGVVTEKHLGTLKN